MKSASKITEVFEDAYFILLFIFFSANLLPLKNCVLKLGLFVYVFDPLVLVHFCFFFEYPFHTLMQKEELALCLEIYLST